MYILSYYIIRESVVTTSICVYVSNQVQYDMKCAQYPG